MGKTNKLYSSKVIQRTFNATLVFFALTVLFCTKIFAQNNPNTVVIKPVFGGHALLDQGQLLHDRLYGLDLGFQKIIEQDVAEWARRSKVKSYGLELVIRNFDSFKGAGDTISSALGSAIGLLAQLEFRMLTAGKTDIVFAPALGLSYSTKTFFTHSQNRFIGSHFNEMLKADLGAQIPLSPTLTLLAGAAYLHLSNGGYRVPNGGLNTVNMYVGMKINTRTNHTAMYSSTEKHLSKTGNPFNPLKRNSFELMAGFGQRGIFEQKRAKYRSSFFAGYNYYLNELISLKTGMDAVYYHSVFDPSNEVETFQNYGTSYDKWRTGVSLGADLSFWRVTVNTQIGKYIHYNRYFKNATWYWGFGPTYYVTPHIGLQARTYMHFAQADFISYGLVARL